MFRVLLLFCLISCSAGAQVLSLDSVLARIEKNNPALKVYDSRINAVNAYAQGALALSPPEFGLGPYMSPYNPMYWKPGEMSEDGMGFLMISAEQMFMNRKKRKAESGFMKSMGFIETEMKGSMKNQMLSMAKMDYYEWVILEMKLQVLKSSESLMKHLLEISEGRYIYGMDKAGSYYKGKAMLGDVQSMLVMTSLEIKQKRISLNTLMALPQEEDFTVDTVLPAKNYAVDVPDTGFIKTQRSDYRLLTGQLNLMKMKQEYERSKRLPDFGLRYEHMFPYGKEPYQFSLMAMITVPIAPWAGKGYKSSVLGAGYEIDAIRQSQNAFINSFYGELSILREKAASVAAQIALYNKTIIPSLRKNYETLLLAYQQNTEELFMVLDAWQNLKMGQLSYLDLREEQLMLRVEYEQKLEIR